MRPRVANIGNQPPDRPPLNIEVHPIMRHVLRNSVGLLELAMSLPSYAMGQASFPEMYERWLVGPLFKPWAEMTFDRLALFPRDRVLDIACGTGIVARVA